MYIQIHFQLLHIHKIISSWDMILVSPLIFQHYSDHFSFFQDYIGPFWCLRAALGPLVETYILLDRLLFLQEQSNLVEALLFPLFDPTMSPRNMAIIAWKLSSNSSEA